MFSQILLNLGTLSHDTNCRSSQTLSLPAGLVYEAHNSCNCEHNHKTSTSADRQFDINPTPFNHCTCKTRKSYPYLFGAKIVEIKTKEHILDAISIASKKVSFSQFSQLLCLFNQSNAPPSQRDYVTQHDARFTSIHLGVFLI